MYPALEGRVTFPEIVSPGALVGIPVVVLPMTEQCARPARGAGPLWIGAARPGLDIRGEVHAARVSLIARVRSEACAVQLEVALGTDSVSLAAAGRVDITRPAAHVVDTRQV